MTLHPIVALAVVIAGLGSPASAETLALTHANVVDVRSGKVLADQTIVIEGSRIVSIGTPPPPSGAKVLDLAGQARDPRPHRRPHASR